MARPPKGPKSVETLVHDDATRKNIPTAELQATAEYLEEMHPAEPVAYPRARPLAQGATRERDEDLDPQIIWNGARIRLTKAQIEQLSETGQVEIGDAQLVWRGKGTQDWSDLIVQTPPTLRSPGAPMSSCSMTGPTKTRTGCGWPGRSRSRACRRTAWCRPTQTQSVTAAS